MNLPSSSEVLPGGAPEDPARPPAIVYIDDDASVLAALRRLLRAEPYRVLTTVRPEDALLWTREQPIRLLIADQRMPDMSGTELLRRVRRQSPFTHRALMTAYPSPEISRECREIGVRRVITKPWEPEDVRDWIRQTLREKAPPSGGAAELEKWVEDGWERTFRLAYMMLHEAEAAEDVAQETAARVIEKIDQLRSIEDLSSWSCSIALNLCRVRLNARKTGAHPVDPTVLDGVLLKRPSGTPSSRAIRGETYQRAAVAVAGLPPGLREVFILHYVEGWPYRKVGRVCGLGEEAARGRALRARRMLQRELMGLFDPPVRRRMEADEEDREA